MKIIIIATRIISVSFDVLLLENSNSLAITVIGKLKNYLNNIVNISK